MKFRRIPATAVAAAVAGLSLVACGGGGGGPTGPNTAEGFWSGPVSTGYQVNLAVLETGEAWGIYSSGSTIYGAFHGTAQGTGTALSGSGSDYNFVLGSVTSGSLSGSVSARSSMSFRTSGGVTGNLGYSTTYDTPASLGAIAGTYAVSGRTSRYSLSSLTVTVGGNGSFAFVDGACSVSGSLIPRASGKNIYNLSVRFIGSCAFPSGSTLTGVTYLDTKSSPNRMLALGLTGDQSDGLILIGSRQP